MERAPDGRVLAFPAEIDEPWIAEGVVHGQPLPWGMPCSAGQYGHPKVSGEPELLVLFEWPITHPAAGFQAINQDLVEELHIQRYATDFLAVAGSLPYANLVRGDEPPDFKAISAENGDRGVDMTQLTFGKRRAAQAKFDQIRQAVLESPRQDFARLQGHIIFLWFTEGASLAEPGRDAESVESVLDALRQHTPDTSWTKINLEETPDRLPVEKFETHPGGFTLYAYEIEHAVPASNLFELRGFELGLAHQTRHPANDAWRELQRIVSKHDKPAIQDLLVTVGGPGKSGLMFPSDELLLQAALNSEIESLETNHLERVIVHEWSTGRIVPVFPEFQINPPVRPSGVIPPFYLLND